MEGCPKCIGGVDKDGESDHLDGKMLVFKIKQNYQSEVIEGNSQLHQKHELELNVLRLVWKNKERLSELISKAAREDLRRPGAGDCVASVRQQKYDKPEIQIV